MRLPQLKCKCSELIIKSVDETSKIRSKIVLVKGGSVYAICKQCTTEVELPLKVENTKANPPLIIKNIKNS